jgi:diguanylate cyclase (GGDEF)-like protein/PAS domain S-box-containing protein
MKTAPHVLSSRLQLALVFAGTALLMTAFEGTKEWLATESMTRWQSHLITILVAAAFATLAAYFIRKAAMVIEQVLQDNLEELRLAASVCHNSADAILITDAAGRIASVNPAFTKITGHSEAEVLGSVPAFLCPHSHPPELLQSMSETLARDGRWQGEFWNRKKNGEAFLEWATIDRIANSIGDLVRYVCVSRDVTELKQRDAHFRHLAFHDALTGLPNRLLFHERLDHALKRSTRDGERLSLIFIDLNGFKEVNDSLGHEAGDFVLKAVATRFHELLRRSADTVARYGGDEFVILIEDLKDAGQCVQLAHRVVTEMARPIDYRGHCIRIGASIGMAFFPQDGNTREALLQHADAAMYSAKLTGKASVHLQARRNEHVAEPTSSVQPIGEES